MRIGSRPFRHGSRMKIGPKGTWTPLVLSSSLIAWWDASRSDLITQAGGVVSSWRDIVGGYAAIQATGAAQPAYSATGFNGFPVISGDGVDDELTFAPLPAGFPTGATACEEWYLVDQKSLVADTTTRTIGSYGGAVTRSLRRLVTTGVNRAQTSDSGSTVSHGTADFSNRHVVRLIATGTQVNIEVDGVVGVVASQVSATSTSRLRFFAGSGTSAAAFALAGISERVITLPLSATNAALMLAYLSRRL